jgi:hypothetical protein
MVKTVLNNIIEGRKGHLLFLKGKGARGVALGSHTKGRLEDDVA